MQCDTTPRAWQVIVANEVLFDREFWTNISPGGSEPAMITLLPGENLFELSMTGVLTCGVQTEADCQICACFWTVTILPDCGQRQPTPMPNPTPVPVPAPDHMGASLPPPPPPPPPQPQPPPQQQQQPQLQKQPQQRSN